MPRGLTNEIPRGRIVQAARADLSRISVVKDLADARREIAVALEHLRQRLHVGQNRAEIGLQLVKSASCRAAGRSAARRGSGLHSGNWVYARSKRTPRVREPIEVRRLHHRMAERAHVVVQIVGHDDQDVRAAGALLRERRLRAGRGRRKKQHDGGTQDAAIDQRPARDEIRDSKRHLSPPICRGCPQVARAILICAQVRSAFGLHATQR